MQALILAGGEGTRLRPLTSTVPKPVVPLVDRPFIAFMLDWLRCARRRRRVMSCGHMADGVRDVLGDGSAFGVRLRYVEEPRPLGTGGALKLAEALLDERFLMLNGDVLTDIDLTRAARAARGDGRARRRSALYPVEDPSAYGLVRLDGDGAVTEFVEKPAPDQIDTNNISAGVYVLERSVLDLLEPEQPASIERDVFPRLVGDGLHGHVAQRLLDGHRDARALPAGHVRHPRGHGAPPRSPRGMGGDVRVRRGRRRRAAAGSSRPRWWRAAAGSRDGARVGGRTVLEHGVTVGEGTTDRAVRGAARARRSARTARCAAASSARARGSATTASSRA